MAKFDADAARRGGMSEHHIDWSVQLAKAQDKAEADPSEKNTAAYDELVRQVTAAHQYEREIVAGVPEEQRLGKQRADGSWRWHVAVGEAEQDPTVPTSRPALLPEGAVQPPPDGAAQAPTIEGSAGV